MLGDDLRMDGVPRWLLFGCLALCAAVALGAALLLVAGVLWFGAPRPPVPQAVAVEDGLVFAFRRAGGIFVSTGAETPPLRIGEGAFAALSPDRARAVFDAGDRFVVRALDGGAETSLDRRRGGPVAPAWSPDGGRLALVLEARRGGAELCVWTLADGAVTKVLGAGASESVFDLFWDHDGASLWYQDMRSLRRVGLDGALLEEIPLVSMTGSETCVTSADRFRLSPVDPNLVVFSRMVTPGPRLAERLNDEGTALYLHDRAAGRTTRLTTDEDFVAFAPAWTPDGRWILFCGYGAERVAENYPFRIHRIAPDGGAPIEVFEGEDPAP